MITRTYHFYVSGHAKETGRVAVHHSTAVSIKSWLPRSAKEIVAEIEGNAKDMPQFEDMTVMVRSVARIS